LRSARCCAHLGRQPWIGVALPPSAEDRPRLDASVEVLGEAELVDAARERRLDVAVDQPAG
jgi:hypothetical protein